MWNKKKVSLVFPAYNEEENIAQAIMEFSQTGLIDEIIVVDNNSSDQTKTLAKKAGARVIVEKEQGYGAALKRGLKEAKGYYIITSEPDGSFAGKDIKRMLQKSKDYDCVLGTRTNKKYIEKGAKMGFFLHLGNILLAKMIQIIYRTPKISDVGCTMKLIKKDSLDRIVGKLKVNRSHFSPELMITILKANIKTTEMPVSYRKRIGQSKITNNLWKSTVLGLKMIILIISKRFESDDKNK